jgi:hypothetical protein
MVNSKESIKATIKELESELMSLKLRNGTKEEIDLIYETIEGLKEQIKELKK